MNIPPLVLDKERASRLLGYIQEYRRYTLTQPPSADRNTYQRLLQALQGRLIQESERERQPFLSFSLTVEEAKALKTMVADLCLLKAQGPKTEQIYHALVDLSGLKGVLEQIYLSESRKHYTKNLS